MLQLLDRQGQKVLSSRRLAAALHQHQKLHVANQHVVIHVQLHGMKLMRIMPLRAKAGLDNWPAGVKKAEDLLEKALT